MKKQFCIHGHEIAIVGRTGGNCNGCILDNPYYKPVENDKRLKQFCINGHDTFVCGRYKSGRCKICVKECGIKRAISKVDEIRAQKRQYNRSHKAEINLTKKLRLRNPSHRLAYRLRIRLYNALKYNAKRGSAVKDLGCSIDFLKQYLEAKFLPSMTWDNWGRGNDKWHIDHIIPLSSFDLTDREQFLKAVHYTNLQPLWEPDNLRKGSKILTAGI